MVISSPADIIAAMLESAPALAGRVRAMVRPVSQSRQAIRAHFIETGQITPTSQVAPYQVGCADGGSVITPTKAGDHISTLAVAVAEVDSEGGVGAIASRAWSDFRAHSHDAETLAKAVMMAHELEMLATIPDDTIKMVDGSLRTHLTALYTGLAATDDRTRDRVISVLHASPLTDTLTHLTQNAMVLGCPKADSSVSVWRTCAEVLDLPGDPIPDKTLATLVLEPGESLVTTTSAGSWAPLHAARARVTDPRAKLLADQITTLTQSLTIDTIRVHLAKPHGSTTALRIETNAALDDFTRDDVISSLCMAVTAPFIEEPLPQHIADLFAKNVAVGASVHLEALYMDLSPDDVDLIEYLRPYRTE